MRNSVCRSCARSARSTRDVTGAGSPCGTNMPMCTAVDPSVMASRSPNWSYIAPTSSGVGCEVPCAPGAFVVGFVAKTVSSEQVRAAGARADRSVPVHPSIAPATVAPVTTQSSHARRPREGRELATAIEFRERVQTRNGGLREGKARGGRPREFTGITLERALPEPVPEYTSECLTIVRLLSRCRGDALADLFSCVVLVLGIRGAPQGRESSGANASHCAVSRSHKGPQGEEVTP